MGNCFHVENRTWKSDPWRNGNGYNCSFELYPKAKGVNYVVFTGTASYYNKRFLCWSDPTDVVVKVMRRRSPMEDTHWEQTYLKCYKVSVQLVKPFNNFLRENGRRERVAIVQPVTTSMQRVSDLMCVTRLVKRFSKKLRKGEYVVFEEKLPRYFEKYTMDNGEAGLGGKDVVEAFGHFAYHHTNGELVLCKLRGVFSGGEYRLVTPSVHSVAQTYVEMDEEEDVIGEFFRNHRCNSLCVSLLRPDDTDTNRTLVKRRLSCD